MLFAIMSPFIKIEGQVMRLNLTLVEKENNIPITLQKL